MLKVDQYNHRRASLLVLAQCLLGLLAISFRPRSMHTEILPAINNSCKLEIYFYFSYRRHEA